MSFVTAQLQLAFIMVSLRAVNLGLVAHSVGLVGVAFENKGIGQPLSVVLPRHFGFLNGSPGHANLCRLKNSC